MNRVDQISYSDFLNSYFLPNQPLLIASPLTQAWPLFSSWLTNESEVKWSYLKEQYGAIWHSVNVGHEDKECALRDVFDLWERGDGKSIYVKDLHLPLEILKRGENSVEEELYSIVDLARDDWMNSFYAAHTRDDFRFVYLGGGQTFTGLHRDVYCSYSISSNIIGRKRWTLFPPHLTAALLPIIRAAELKDELVDVRSWTRERTNELLAQGMIEVIQEERETIFVPSGWYHQVENLSHPTFSLNHNWCNSVNLPTMYNSMAEETALVRASIEDVESSLRSRGSLGWEIEWQACVDDLMTKSSGWNYLTFWRMVLHGLDSIDSDTAPVKSAWPVCDGSLRPSTEFILNQIRPSLADFVGREEREFQRSEGLEHVLSAVVVAIAKLS